MPKRPARERSLRWGEGRIKVRDRRDRDPVYQALWLERQPDGSTRERAQSFTSRDAAEDHLREIQRAKRDGRYRAQDGTTVADLMRDWLARGAADWAPSTLQGNRIVVDRHIAPRLGSVRLSALTAPQVQRWIDELGAVLAPSSTRRVIRCLRSALRSAVRLGLIPANPAEGARGPSARRATPATWTADEVAAMLAGCLGDPLIHTLTVTALATGARPGEVLALRWRDVDLEERVIQIRATMTRDESGRTTVRERTKGGRSRTVAIPAACVVALRRWAGAQREERTAAPIWHELGFVFTRPDGRALAMTTWRKLHDQVAAAAKVPRLTLHQLRHTSATLDMEAGVHPRIVQERLGHRSIQTTLDVYSHVSVDLQRAAADDLGRRLFGDAEAASDATTSSSRRGQIRQFRAKRRATNNEHRTAKT